MTTLAALARPTGTFAMIAMDQRESLRGMFAAAGKGVVSDDVLTAFKRDVARELTPYGSAFLVDRDLGLRGIVDDGLVAPSCAVIAAADALTMAPGGIVGETALDEVVVGEDFDRTGVTAIKLLVIWRRDELREARVELSRRFVEAARRLGLVSVLEPVVRATPQEEADGTFDQSVAIREAARELSALQPDLYKVQMPLGGKGDHETLVAECRLLDEAIATPWVILSQGVSIEDFPGAVRAACAAGASGFLAGRGLWSDVVGADDVAARLREVSVPRLTALGELVDEHGRPWQRAAADKGLTAGSAA